MKKELKDKWIAALESGEYDKAQGELESKGVDGACSYCCLGVLQMLTDGHVSPIRMADDSGDIDDDLPHSSYYEWVGLDPDVAYRLALQNDSTGTFAEVIESIKERVRYTSLEEQISDSAYEHAVNE
tara:strand:+ start:41 stop:421 length:381 start_codon:yes stop_codon:yes gene_type:complete